MALRPHCTQAGKDGTAASRLGSCMGCGMPWQQLWDAVAGARERVPQQPGGQLQQRRQAQQHRCESVSAAHLCAYG
jgi:hypothetical protein